MRPHIEQLDEKDFDKEIFESALPVVVDFGAPWCGPCRMLEPIVEELSVDFAGRTRFFRVNIDDCPGLAARYGIRSIPTLIFFHDGEIKKVHVGFTAKSNLKQLIQKTFF